MSYPNEVVITSQAHAELVGVGDVPADVLVGDGAAAHVHVEQLHHVVRAVNNRLPLRVADPPHPCMQPRQVPLDSVETMQQLQQCGRSRLGVRCTVRKLRKQRQATRN